MDSAKDLFISIMITVHLHATEHFEWYKSVFFNHVLLKKSLMSTKSCRSHKIFGGEKYWLTCSGFSLEVTLWGCRWCGNSSDWTLPLKLYILAEKDLSVVFKEVIYKFQLKKNTSKSNTIFFSLLEDNRSHRRQLARTARNLI